MSKSPSNKKVAKMMGVAEKVVEEAVASPRSASKKAKMAEEMDTSVDVLNAAAASPSAAKKMSKLMSMLGSDVRGAAALMNQVTGDAVVKKESFVDKTAAMDRRPSKEISAGSD